MKTGNDLHKNAFVGYRQPDFDKYEPAGKCVPFDLAVKALENQKKKYNTANTNFDALDDAVAGTLSYDCAGASDKTLTAAEAYHGMIVLTGRLRLIST